MTPALPTFRLVRDVTGPASPRAALRVNPSLPGEMRVS
jgi:hypothetical protein